MASAPAKDGRRPSLLWLQGLACGGVATLATPSAILMAILLTPALAAIALDRSEGRAMARTVVLCGMAGAIEPMVTLWKAGHTNDVALGLALDTRVFVLAWAAQGAGWLASELAPLLVRLALESAAAARVAALRRARARYEEEWDLGSPPA